MIDRMKWASEVWKAYKNKNLSMGERDVLLTLRTYATTGVAWPSIFTLVQRTGLSESTIKRAIRAGQELGLIHVTPGGRWMEQGRWISRSNRYRLLMPIVTAVRGRKYQRVWKALGVHLAPGGEKRIYHTTAECYQALGLPVQSALEAQIALAAIAERRKMLRRE